jgi:hypothetical protein
MEYVVASPGEGPPSEDFAMHVRSASSALMVLIAARKLFGHAKACDGKGSELSTSDLKRLADEERRVNRQKLGDFAAL